jgi:hypothetical protein
MDFSRSKVGKYSAYDRIDLPEDIEIFPEELQAVDHAADGCGHFDWDTVELVGKDGHRVKVAQGVYENITGIYWLKSDTNFSLDMLEEVPEEPIIIGEDYVVPPPHPAAKRGCDESAFRASDWDIQKEDNRRVNCYVNHGYRNLMNKHDRSVYEELNRSIAD